MVIEPMIRKNVCINAHPKGCLVQVKDQISYVRKKGTFSGPSKVLIIGSSNGYGLAARIVSAFGCGADSVGIAYEKEPSERRTGTAGWYNDRAFKIEAEAAGLKAVNVNGDAFSTETKNDVFQKIEENLGSVDMVVYSIAAPRRKDPETGELYSSVIKPIGESFTSRSVDFNSGTVSEITAEPASDEEVEQTIKVMGGEDWRLWIEGLSERNLISPGFLTVAFSYIGPELTFPIYRHGTIGKAKEDLEKTAAGLNEVLSSRNGRAVISINKALVTRASAVIPAVPLYISLLYKVMKRKGLHEGCIQQMYRLFRESLFADGAERGSAIKADEKGRIRIDDWEMRKDVQAEVEKLWNEVTTENVEELTDIKGFREEFLRHHGFGIGGIDYNEDTAVDL